MKITWSNFVEKNGMRFYGALERQVRDQIKRTSDTTRRDTLEWMTKSTSHTLTERNFGRGEDSKGIIKGTGISLEGRAYGAGLPASIRQRFQFVEQSPRVVQ